MMVRLEETSQILTVEIPQYHTSGSGALSSAIHDSSTSWPPVISNPVPSALGLSWNQTGEMCVNFLLHFLATSYPRPFLNQLDTVRTGFDDCMSTNKQDWFFWNGTQAWPTMHCTGVRPKLLVARHFRSNVLRACRLKTLGNSKT